LSGELKWGALRSADAFALISHQENFGIAVVEALACGTPVIISDQVNIWREIAGHDAGMVCSDTQEGAVRALRNWAAQTRYARALASERAKACYEAHFHIEAAAARLLEVVSGAAALAGRGEGAARAQAQAAEPDQPDREKRDRRGQRQGSELDVLQLDDVVVVVVIEGVALQGRAVLPGDEIMRVRPGRAERDHEVEILQ